MKTALKIIGGIFATLILAIVVFWIGWLRPPNADKVCDNVEEVTVASYKKQGIDLPDALKKELRGECTDWAGTPPEFGRGPWVKSLKCARDAEDMKALEACDAL